MNKRQFIELLSAAGFYADVDESGDIWIEGYLTVLLRIMDENGLTSEEVFAILDEPEEEEEDEDE